MKKLAFILVIAICLPAVVSCDFVRRLAGRPDTAVVEQYRQQDAAEQRIADSLETLARERAEAARLDSLKTVQDSIAALDTLGGMGVILNRRSDMKNFTDVTMPARYVIVAGVYVKKYNTSRAFEKFASANVPCVSLEGAGGRTAVGICPSDKVKDVCRAFVLNSGILPADAWILVDE
ncbi:MAG: hypothetical protein MJY62_03615 [Bacteroidales bacterium]|nr:hypothetical protein [Bacteroidales bacterium]